MLSAAHEPEDLEKRLEMFEKVSKALRVIQ